MSPNYYTFSAFGCIWQIKSKRVFDHNISIPTNAPYSSIKYGFNAFPTIKDETSNHHKSVLYKSHVSYFRVRFYFVQCYNMVTEHNKKLYSLVQDLYSKLCITRKIFQVSTYPQRTNKLCSRRNNVYDETFFRSYRFRLRQSLQ